MASQKTLVKKITVGIPIAKVVGAQAQSLDDLTDVTNTGLQDDHILQYNASSGKWENVGLVTGGTF